MGTMTQEEINTDLFDEVKRLKKELSGKESQLKAEMKLNNSLSEQLKELKIWEFFASFLLDNKEGEIITEENLQRWLAEAIKEQNKVQ